MFALCVGFVNVRVQGAVVLPCSPGCSGSRSLSCTRILPTGSWEKSLQGAARLRDSAGRRSPHSHSSGVEAGCARARGPAPAADSPCTGLFTLAGGYGSQDPAQHLCCKAWPR